MSRSRTKIKSLAAIIAPKYSASAELKETDFCIFENQWNKAEAGERYWIEEIKDPAVLACCERRCSTSRQSAR